VVGLVSKILSMKNCKIISLLRYFSLVGLLSCLCLFALTATVHTHTAAVDHVQHKCPVCLLGVSSKALVIPLAASPLYCEARAFCDVPTPRHLALPLWDNLSSRSPPSIA
jgi:hypothetical protein